MSFWSWSIPKKDLAGTAATTLRPHYHFSSLPISFPSFAFVCRVTLSSFRRNSMIRSERPVTSRRFRYLVGNLKFEVSQKAPHLWLEPNTRRLTPDNAIKVLVMSPEEDKAQTLMSLSNCKLLHHNEMCRMRRQSSSAAGRAQSRGLANI
jgi:hypothetical protein